MFNRSIAWRAASLGAAMYAGIFDALARQTETHEGRIFGHENIRHHIVRTRYGLGGKLTSFDPRINRWTRKPHEHRMEIARRKTKPGTPERRTAEMAARAGFMP